MYTRPQKLGKALSWLAGQAEPLCVFLAHSSAFDESPGAASAGPSSRTIARVLQLAHLASAEGQKKVAPVIACLGDARIYDTALRPGEYGKQIARALNDMDKDRVPERRLSPKLPGELDRWLTWLLRADSPIRRRALRLFRLTGPSPAVEVWAAWWQRAERCADEARKWAKIVIRAAARVGNLTRAHGQRLAQVRQSIERMRRDTPAAIAVRDLFAAVVRESQQASESRYRAICRALEHLPDGDGQFFWRPGLLIHWNVLRGWVAEGLSGGRGDPSTRIIASFASYLAATGASERALQPWLEHARAMAAGKDRYSFEGDLACGDGEPGHIENLFSAARLAHDGFDGELTPDLLEVLWSLVRATGEPESSVGLAASLARDAPEVGVASLPVTKGALALCGGELEHFAPLVAVLDRAERDELLDRSIPLSAMAELFAARPGLLRQLCMGGDLRRVIGCAGKLHVLATLGARASASPHLELRPGPLPAWAQSYPEKFHEPLRLILAVASDPHKSVERVLSRAFPDPQATRRELAAVRQRLDKATGIARQRMAKRASNLESRLTRPRLPSDEKLARLAKKLWRVAGLAVLDDWENGLDAQLRDVVPDFLGLARHQNRDDMEWLFQDRTLSLIGSIAGLGRGHRRLARRLFRARAGPPPWDLRSAARNAAFVAALEKRGVDMKPWLDGLAPLQRKDRKGRPVVLTLEDDPIEIFHMGGHFKTCLSPGDCNFFSVFANAADINKRVVYARRDGQVVGRCLLALTDVGAILTFHVYSHDYEAGIADFVGELVVQLAEAMGAFTALRGNVPTLLASEWYDDGPIDVTGRFGFLADGSPFRDSLRSIDPGDLVPRLRELLEPRDLDGLTLPMIVGLSEIADRPELIVPLIPALLTADLPDSVRLTAALRLEKAGARDAARRIFGHRAGPYLSAYHRRVGQLDFTALDFLCRTDPGRALAVLRQTRPRGVRRWSDELRLERVLAGAKATAALHRKKQAAALYRHALGLRGREAYKQEARERLAELEA